MDFDTFCEHCSVDLQPNGDETSVLVIFSVGIQRSFNKDFVKSNQDLTEDLVMSDLYDYLYKEFGSA